MRLAEFSLHKVQVGGGRDMAPRRRKGGVMVQTIPASARLAVYGVSEEQVHRNPLTLEQGQRLVLHPDTIDLSGCLVRLRAQSAQDLKIWMGISDEALQRPSGLNPRNTDAPIVSAQKGTARTAENYATANAALHNFALSHSSSVTTHAMESIDSWVRLINPEIHLWIFTDVYVAAGSQLALSAGSVLFADRVTVEDGGY